MDVYPWKVPLSILIKIVWLIDQADWFIDGKDFKVLEWDGNSKAQWLDLGSICYIYLVTYTLLHIHCYAPVFELKSRVEDTISIQKMCNSFHP